VLDHNGTPVHPAARVRAQRKAEGEESPSGGAERDTKPGKAEVLSCPRAFLLLKASVGSPVAAVLPRASSLVLLWLL